MALTEIGTQAHKLRVSCEAVEKAVNSLLKWMRAQQKKRQILNGDEMGEEFMFLVISMKKVPFVGNLMFYKIPMPHPLVTLESNSNLCLIINDKEKGAKAQFALNKIEKEGLKISNVLKFSKLKSDFKDISAKRELCELFDLFLADQSLFTSLPRVLGKGIFKKRKQPIPVDLKKDEWKTEIEEVCRSAILCTETSKCCFVKVAWSYQTKEQIVENVMSVIEGLPSKISKKWKNIKALHLKFPDSLALPLYEENSWKESKAQKRSAASDDLPNPKRLKE
eukprot:TRINITY_DN38826_c0_g1_i1.p1 TRINITY_DN38826_c0_g1~~TRINITY_DN38826_c0_g1_i1.p1  ORF type:complete len:279 (-),score=46.15 TRINITY_DN38826_c0_g1_i1:461-1297(-)